MMISALTVTSIVDDILSLVISFQKINDNPNVQPNDVTTSPPDDETC